jgi:DUF1680 family protein
MPELDQGTCYQPDSTQKVHQAYGRAYQLPQETAHNEACANIGNMLWNFRMLQATVNAKYTDIMELTYYNSILSGMSLDGKKYLYTNPLSQTAHFPYTLRWGDFRQGYLTCFCCPPNTFRTIAEANNYAYALSGNDVYCNLYGSNTLKTKTADGAELKIAQESDYPWNGLIRLKMERVPDKTFSLFLRIPEWGKNVTITVNGKPENNQITPGTYAEIHRIWKKGDVVELNIPYKVRLIESNPLVEEPRNQVAIIYGPMVYCLESIDLPEGTSIYDIIIPADIQFQPEYITIEGNKIVALQGKAKQIIQNDWNRQLYREITTASQEITISLIPYYAWGNRGNYDMSVWLRLR